MIAVALRRAICFVALAQSAALAGCAGAGEPATSAPAQQPAFLSALPQLTLTAGRAAAGAGSVPREIAVDDFDDGLTLIFNHDYKPVRTIARGLSGLTQYDWYDAQGNLYITNYFISNVVEYAPHAKKPTFTYSTGLGAAVAVATDASDNVYVADASEGLIEFGQGQNIDMHVCRQTGSFEGVALDKAGDVFATYVPPGSASASVIEYAGGLSDCHATVLGAPLAPPFPGNLAVDNGGNLVVADFSAGTVDIIAPPYSSITSKITGFGGPTTVSLNKAGTLLFVCDFGNKDVVVDTYPGGSTVKTLGFSDNVRLPIGVAVYP